MYSDLIVDLYKHPLNKRSIEKPTITNSGANVTCGDHVRLYLTVENGTVTDASFEGEGCAISMATASLITEHARGKSTEEILKWTIETVFEFLETEVGATRIKCALLPLEVIQEGLRRK